MSEGWDDSDALPIRSVLHPTDFTDSSELAFAHALKIALSGKTRLYILHADPDVREEIDWSEFPGARRTLARWGVLPEGSCARTWLTSSGFTWPRSVPWIATPCERS
jgi:hypothetical protein